MPSDIANSAFLAALAHTSVAACFTSSATLPSNISPVQVLDSVLEAYKVAQSDANEINTGTEFINTIVSVRNEPILFDGNNNPYMDTVSTVRVKKILTTSVAHPYVAPLQLI